MAGLGAVSARGPARIQLLRRVLADAQVHAEVRLVESQRASCSAGTQLRSRLLSTSACTTSIGGGASGHGRVDHRLGGLERNPPSNTEHCAKAVCSHGVSSSHDQSIVASQRRLARRPRRVRRRAAESGRAGASTQLRRRQHAAARRGQLDRKRQAVEQRARSAAPLARLASSSTKSGVARARGRRTARCIAVGGSGSSGNTSSPRRCSRSRLVTTNAASRARSSQRPSVSRGVRDHLLEVVEDHEAAPAAGDRMAELPHGSPAQRHVERRRDGEEMPSSVRASHEVAEVDAAGPVAEPAPAVAARETGLAGAAGTHHGDEPRAGVEPVAVRAARHCDPRRSRARPAGCGARSRNGDHDRPAHDAIRLVDIGRRHERRTLRRRRARTARSAPRCP